MNQDKRMPAEWEEQAFVQVAFPHEDSDWAPYLKQAIENFTKIIEAIQVHQACVVVTSNIKETQSIFKEQKNLTFVQCETNDTWSRDFGGITIEQKNKSKILDFTFNAWGAKFACNFDNQVTRKLKQQGIFKAYGFKSYNFVLEGGAIESDGQGVVMTTSQCLLEANRNPQFSKKQIEKRLKRYLGAQKILWLNHGYLQGDDTDSHIDTLARFANKNTIVYQGCDDTNDVHYKAFKKMKKELQTFTNINQQPYRLVELPWIAPIYDNHERLPATYANFLIINQAVLVPVYGDKNDKKAIGIFKKVFTNRAIVPIDCSTLIKQHGSLHCVTMQYPKAKDKHV